MSTKVERAKESLRKQEIAWRLHVAGATPQEIAASTDPQTRQPLFKDSRGAAQALRAVRNRLREESDPEVKIDDHLKDDLARLNRMQRALFPAAVGGDVAASREIRQIIQTRALLLGYAKGLPEKHDPVGDPIDELTAKREARRSAGA